MTRPEPFAAVHADDLLLDRLAARREPAAGSEDRAAEALLRLARAADAAAGLADTSARPSTGIDSGTDPLVPGRPKPSPTPRRQGHAVMASRILVAAAASVALGLVPTAHDTRPSLPSPVLPAAPVALVRAQALVAEAQGLVAPTDAEPTPAGLDRAASLLAEASSVLDGVRDPVGGTLGVDAVRARVAGVTGALAAARHRLESPPARVQPLQEDATGSPAASAVADRGPARGDGTGVGASRGTRPARTGSHPDTRDDAHDVHDDAHDHAEGADDSGPGRNRGGTTGSSGGHGSSETSDAEHASDAENPSDRVGDDESDAGSGDGSDSGSGRPGSGGEGNGASD